MDSFPNFAGDVETLLLNIKITHAKRTFGKPVNTQKLINIEDVEAGYERYLENRGIKLNSTSSTSMYS